MRRIAISMLSLIVLLYSACTQKDDQGLDKQNKVQHLRISAEVKLQGTRSIDYKLVDDKVRSSLGNKTEISVYTCIYQGSTPLFNQWLNWTVGSDKRTLSFDGDINLNTAGITDPDNLKILAVIGEATGDPTNLTLTPSYKEDQTIQLLSPTTPTSINVPYIMEVSLRRDGSGYWIPRGEQVIFKPYGHLLRVRMTNKTGAAVTVTGVSSNRLLADGIKFHPRFRDLKRKEYDTPLNLQLSSEVTIANNETASKTFLLWVPRLEENVYHRLDLAVKDTEMSRLYTTIRIPKKGLDYIDGVIYKAEVTLYKTAIPNPLSLLSKDVINKEGTDFVNLRNTFRIDDLSTYNGSGKVGYFKHADAIDRFCIEKTYPSTGGINWHLPDFFEWNTILYDPLNPTTKNYTDREDRVRVKVGVGSQASQRGQYSYWKTISYAVHVPNDAKDTYIPETGGSARPTIKTGTSFYVLSFASASSQLPDDKTPHRFPREEENINRYAFRYTLYEDRFVITCVPIGIQDISVTDLPKLPALFSSKSAVSRIIPFYGISNDGSLTNKDNTQGNRRIIDYVTNTRDEKGERIIAAFSTPTNKVLTYKHDIGFPVALFKRVTE